MRPPGEVLRVTDYEVRDVEQRVAADLVARWHYAKGGPNTGVFRHGLFRRGGDEPLGVAWWLPPTKVAAQSVAGEDWRNCLSLTRLVIAPEVPTNGASFLIARSIREIKKHGRWTHLVTYADTGEGHTGAIYLATGWAEVPASRGHPRYVTAEGRHVAAKSANRTRTHAEMLELGYHFTPATHKRKFVMRLR